MTYAEPLPDPDARPSAGAVLAELAWLAEQEAAVTERKLRTLILARALGITWVQLAEALGFTSPQRRHTARSHYDHAVRVISGKDGPHAQSPTGQITQRQARDYLAGRRAWKETPDTQMAP